VYTAGLIGRPSYFVVTAVADYEDEFEQIQDGGSGMFMPLI
jgi:hypothetical protein